MRARLHFVVVLLLAGLGQAQVVDRMVAVVNKRVILASDAGGISAASQAHRARDLC